MRHRKRSSKLGRTSAHRRALYRNLVTALLERERIETTDAKAKEVRRVADRMITLGKRGTLHARRRALRVIRDRDVAAKVFDDLAVRFRERRGGYTRVLKVRYRTGDAAPLSIVELVDGPVEARPAKKKSPAKKAAPARKTSAKADRPASKAKKASSKKASAKKTTAKKAVSKKAATVKASTKKATRKKSD